MKEIKLTQGKVALVDDEDFHYLNQWKWTLARCKSKFYAKRNLNINGVRKVTYMHRLIMNTCIGKECDHRDRNGLNNQKINLKNCTHAQNQMNKRYSGKSKYMGVSIIKSKYKNKTYNYIAAHICPNGKKIHLGRYKTEIDAAIAIDRAAVKYFGEFANLNFK